MQDDNSNAPKPSADVARNQRVQRYLNQQRNVAPIPINFIWDVWDDRTPEDQKIGDQRHIDPNYVWSSNAFSK